MCVCVCVCVGGCGWVEVGVWVGVGGCAICSVEVKESTCKVNNKIGLNRTEIVY